MAEDLETLIIRVQADISDVRKDMDVLKRTTSSAASRVKSSMRTMRSGFQGVTAALNGMVPVLTGVVAGFVSFRQVVNSLNGVDALAKTADRLGLTTQALQSLRFATEQTGGEARILETSLQRMNRRIAEAAKGGGPAADALEELGLDAVQLQAIGTEEAFVAIAEALRNVDNVSKKTAAAFKIFDTEGGRLINTFELGREGLQEYKERVEELGIAITRVDAAKIEQANDMMDTFGRTIDAVSNNMTVQLAPALTFVSEQMLEYTASVNSATKSSQGIGDIVVKGFALASDAIAAFKLAWEGLKVVTAGYLELYAKVFRGILEVTEFTRQKVVAAWNVLEKEWVVAIDSIKAAWYLLSSELLTILQPAFDLIADKLLGIGRLAGIASEEWENKLVRAAAGLQKGYAKAVQDATNDATEAQEKLGESLDELSTATEEFLSDVDVETNPAVQFFRNIATASEETRKEAVADFNKLYDAVSIGGTPGEQVLQEWEQYKQVVSEAAEEVAQARRKMTQVEGPASPAATPADVEGMGGEEDPLAGLRGLSGEGLADTLRARIQAEEYVGDQLLQKRVDILNQIIKAEKDATLEIRTLWESGAQGQMTVMQNVGQGVAKMFGNLSTLMASENDTMFQIGKAAAIAQASVSAILGAQQAYTSLSGIAYVGPALGAAAAAAAIAAGAANVAKISSTPPPSATGGGAAAVGGANFGGVAAAAGRANAQVPGGIGEVDERPVIRDIGISIEGDRFSKNEIRQLIEQINEATDDNVRLGAGDTFV